MIIQYIESVIVWVYGCMCILQSYQTSVVFTCLQEQSFAVVCKHHKCTPFVMWLDYSFESFNADVLLEGMRENENPIIFMFWDSFDTFFQAQWYEYHFAFELQWWQRSISKESKIQTTLSDDDRAHQSSKNMRGNDEQWTTDTIFPIFLFFHFYKRICEKEVSHQTLTLWLPFLLLSDVMMWQSYYTLWWK